MTADKCAKGQLGVDQFEVEPVISLGSDWQRSRPLSDGDQVVPVPLHRDDVRFRKSVGSNVPVEDRGIDRHDNVRARDREIDGI